MDSHTRKLLNAVREYLDEVGGMSKMPISEDMVTMLQEVADGLNGDAQEVPLSPGEKQAQEHAGGELAELKLDEPSDVSPGRRAAEEAEPVS